MVKVSKQFLRDTSDFQNKVNQYFSETDFPERLRLIEEAIAIGSKEMKAQQISRVQIAMMLINLLDLKDFIEELNLLYELRNK